MFLGVQLFEAIQQLHLPQLSSNSSVGLLPLTLELELLLGSLWFSLSITALAPLSSLDKNNTRLSLRCVHYSVNYGVHEFGNKWTDEHVYFYDTIPSTFCCFV